MSRNHDADTPKPVSHSPNHGFVIDGRNCIGCHACSTACKSENEVPLGVYRTWVKTTETGLFPDTQRHFQVTRCNHCNNPPCTRICPTQAMYQRDDGIVEFASDACIGCKACMQACPYDAIYIDPESLTAAKCNFCAPRIDVGLEPACVVVCPEHAILAGDLNDPTTEIAKVLAREKVTVRKPEQGTAPKVFYIDGNDVNMHPTATERTPTMFATADVLPLHPETVAATAPKGIPARGPSGAALRPPQPQGLPDAGPIQIGGSRAEHMVQVGYNAQHKVPWHWPVPAYLVTKGIGSGILMVLGVAWLMGLPFDGGTAVAGGLLSVVMMLATTALLVGDLERPERFLYILARPNWRSWLARGALFLMGFSTVGGLWWALETAAVLGIDGGLASMLRTPLLIAALPLALGTAIYTAFLFGQAEGRDLWQSPLLPPHLLIQAVMMGAAGVLLIDLVVTVPPELVSAVRWTFGISLAVDLFVTLLGEFGMPHASEVAARAAHEISHGRYRNQFWVGSIVVGHLVPLLMLMLGGAFLAALGALASIAGLYLFEHAFVMAPQEVPNS